MSEILAVVNDVFILHKFAAYIVKAFCFLTVLLSPGRWTFFKDRFDHHIEGGVLLPY